MVDRVLTALRQALDRGGALKAAAKIATGHNADDIAETVLLNILRGDLPRCVESGVRDSPPRMTFAPRTRLRQDHLHVSCHHERTR